MLPLRDINPTRTTPVVNYLIILANVAAFIWTSTLPPYYETGYGLVPTRIVSDPSGELFTIFTSMFMHANLLHIAGNMWFLWIFGDNVEDALGHFRYLAFYLIAGIAAAVTQVSFNLTSTLPMVGASGAIAGVTAGYLVLFPRAPVLILNPLVMFLPLLFFLITPTLVVPAWVVAGEFFVVNLFSGVQSLHVVQGQAPPMGGVAFFAHVGGFVAGLILVKPMSGGRPRNTRRDWDGWRPPVRAGRMD